MTLRTAGLLLCALSLVAGDAPLPSAARVLDRYVEVTGGRAAWLTKSSETDEIEGRTPDGARVVLRARVAMTRDGNSRARVTAPEDAEEGVFNGVAWVSTKLSGARIKHGADREQALVSARMLEEVRWRELYPRSRVEAVDLIDGRPCYRVALLPSAIRRLEWFDAQSGLLVQKASESDEAYTYRVEEWRAQDGLRQPATLLGTRGDFTYRLRVLSVRYNAPERFEPPEAVEQARVPGALPNAEELIERHIFESGGLEAYSHIQTQRVTGELEFVDRNMTAQTEAVSAGGGRYYEAVDVPGLGRTEQGSDGSVAWERSPTLGPRARSGAKLQGLGVTLQAAEVVNWRSMLSSVRTEAEEVLDGRDCYRVRLTLRNGQDGGLRWYERNSGLLYRTSAPMKTEMGSIPAVLTYLEYRAVEGLKWPVRIGMKMGGQDLMFVAREVELNQPLADTYFSLPDDVRTLACNAPSACPAP